MGREAEPARQGNREREREQICEPGSDEWVTLDGAAEALFAFRQGGIQEQVFVSQHSQNWLLWTVRHLQVKK